MPPTLLGAVRAPAIDSSRSLGVVGLPGDQAPSLGVIGTAVARPMFGLSLYPTTDAYPRTLWKVGATSRLGSALHHAKASLNVCPTPPSRDCPPTVLQTRLDMNAPSRRAATFPAPLSSACRCARVCSAHSGGILNSSALNGEEPGTVESSLRRRSLE